ncbi:DNA/RNA non-specific endonuclease [Pseudomonas chlororaphis subsp. piscium]
MASIQKHQLELSAQRAADVRLNLNAAQPLDYAPELLPDASPLKLTTRSAFLFTGGARPSPVELERIIGTNDLVDEFYFDRALLTGMPVCRVLIRSDAGATIGYATGFMVSPRLMLTNEHVFGSPEEAAPSLAEFNYRLGISGEPEPSHRFRLRPDEYFFCNRELDFALVAIEPQSQDGKVPLSSFGYHRLLSKSGKAVLKEWLTIVQHPGGAPRQWAIRENQCIEDSLPDVIWYMSDTAQGSSGAMVTNDSFQVVALHHSGVARKNSSGLYLLKDGSAVTSLEGIDDALVEWIANEGIRISSICECIAQSAPEKLSYLTELKAAMEGGDILSRAFQGACGGKESVAAVEYSGDIQRSGNRIEIGTLVLELEAPLAGIATSLRTGNIDAPRSFLTAREIDRNSANQAREAMREPIVDLNYDSRMGFDQDFLGIETPFPAVLDNKLIALTKAGEAIIHYEHFSVVLHQERRLAIFTASNVDGSPRVKHPEPGYKYTRDELTGLKENDSEKWLLDPRIDERFQIPDRFYTKDNGAFDKGHIVRREDVCWGDTFAQVQRANGDTFHLTNCSPQRGNFNQSGKNGIWGQLENFIGAQADEERFCIFAGPVLSKDDEFFPGTERVQIPSRFWKVVCALKKGKLQVFAFVLEQDLSSIPMEFYINADWKVRQKPLKELEEIVGFLKFPLIYHDGDTF